MSKTLKQHRVELTDEQFSKMMEEIAVASRSATEQELEQSDNPVVIDGGNLVRIFSEYGIDAKQMYGKIPTEDGKMADINVEGSRFAEDDILQDIERLTGRNTFRYSKTQYADAVEDAVQNAGRKGNPGEYMKVNLQNREAAWHGSTGVEVEDIQGKNVYKDPKLQQKMQHNYKVHQLNDMLEMMSQYSSNRYIQMAYQFLNAYEQGEYDMLRYQFGNRNDFKKPFDPTEDLIKRYNLHSDKSNFVKYEDIKDRTADEIFNEMYGNKSAKAEEGPIITPEPPKQNVIGEKKSVIYAGTAKSDGVIEMPNNKSEMPPIELPDTQANKKTAHVPSEAEKKIMREFGDMVDAEKQGLAAERDARNSTLNDIHDDSPSIV